MFETELILSADAKKALKPFFGDQPFWGHRVEALGVGPKAIPRKQLTAQKLADAIQIAIGKTDMRKKAAELGQKIRAEDGVANAVRLLS